MATNNYSKITPEIMRLAEICKSNAIDPELYTTYDVKRGLRDINGKGVLTGLTRISEVNATKNIDGETVPAPGELFYRGINVKEMIKGQPEEMHFPLHRRHRQRGEDHRQRNDLGGALRKVQNL